MSQDYRKIIANYVRGLGQTEAQGMGIAAEFNPRDTEALFAELKNQYHRNQIMIWWAAALWTILFIVGVYFAFHYRDNPKSLLLVLGGNLMVLGGVMLALRRLWLDLSAVGALLAILPGLSSSEAAKVITSFYFNAIDPKANRITRVQPQPVP